MFKLAKQLLTQSRLSALLFAISVGCIFDVLDFFLFGDKVNAPLIVLTIVTSGLTGLFLHEFLKAREKTKQTQS